jgi:hypothetical protein
VFTTISTPISAAVVAFTTALINVVIELGIWSATATQLAAVNTLVLAGLALVSTVQANAQAAGKLTSTPNGSPPASK